MSEHYSGLCVGGPADGKVLKSNDKVLVVTESERIPLDYNPNSVGTFRVTGHVKKAYYQFIPFSFGADDYRGLWAFENATPLEVFDALLAGYKKADRRAVLREAIAEIDDPCLHEEGMKGVGKAFARGIGSAQDRIQALIDKEPT